MNIDSLFQKFQQLKVLVLGDLMVDRYVYGEVTRISPEAPVPVVEWKEEDNRLGGAANVALNVAALGATTYLCGIVGKDQESELFFTLLEENGLVPDLIFQSATRPTSVKTRVIAAKQHLLRLDKEKTEDLHEKEECKVVEKLSHFFRENSIDLVILQDYNKGLLTESLINYVLKTVQSLNIPVTVDPKLKNFWLYKNVNLFKPNLKEVRDVLPFSVEATFESLKTARNFLIEKLKSKLLLITLSENGVFSASHDKMAIFPTQKRKVADVCGAGDGVIAVASLAIAIGLEEDEIALMANLVGGQIVENVGVTIVDKEVLKNEILEWNLKQQQENRF
jgi:rfaE bifunctional protein kinase chain/domain